MQEDKEKIWRILQLPSLSQEEIDYLYFSHRCHQSRYERNRMDAHGEGQPKTMQDLIKWGIIKI